MFLSKVSCLNSFEIVVETLSYNHVFIGIHCYKPVLQISQY